MRYLVRARIKPGEEQPLLQAIDRGTLGRGSVAGGEYLRNMQEARLCSDGTARWVEVCYCPTPSLKSGPTGKSSSNWSRCRMRMTAGSAGIRTARSGGAAANSVLRKAWSAKWVR